MDSYEARTGLRITYADLAEATGLSLATVQSIGSRGEYNATLSVVEALCTTLHVTPAELLEWRNA
jgi:putative transcriptional regulator